MNILRSSHLEDNIAFALTWSNFRNRITYIAKDLAELRVSVFHPKIQSFERLVIAYIMFFIILLYYFIIQVFLT